VLSNESQRILPIQVFISRSTPQTHPELWVIESYCRRLQIISVRRQFQILTSWTMVPAGSGARRAALDEAYKIDPGFALGARGYRCSGPLEMTNSSKCISCKSPVPSQSDEDSAPEPKPLGATDRFAYCRSGLGRRARFSADRTRAPGAPH
jgi:hypothetical protein